MSNKVRDTTMFKVLYGETFKTARLIKECETEMCVYETIREYIDKIGFESYYLRQWNVDNHRVLDYGSHTNFFYVEGGITTELINEV